MSSFAAEAEDQQMESEALESIFVDEFKQLSASPFHWRVELEPYPPGDGKTNHVAIALEAKIPPAYPNEVPNLTIVVVRGLNEDQQVELQTLAESKAGENLGMAMIFTIAEELKEWLVKHNEAPKDNSMFAKMQRRMQEKDKPVEEPPPADLSLEEMWTMTREEEELERNRQKVLDGTAVNAESFALWKAKFDAETAVAAEKSSEKMTGRSYFAAGANVEAWEEPAEEGADGVDEGLFEDEGDLSDFVDSDEDDDESESEDGDYDEEGASEKA